MKPLSSVLLLNGRGVVQVSSAIRLPSRACRYLLVFAIKYKRLTRGGGGGCLGGRGRFGMILLYTCTYYSI